MSNLIHLSDNNIEEEAIVRLLQSRSKVDQPYTQLGNHRLIVVNPNKALGLLNDATLEETVNFLVKLLDELDISYLKKSKAYTLSGGERRRLEITRALVTNPSLILLDEPFSGVDPIAVFEVQKILKKLKHQRLSILLTDHNVRETLAITDRSYLLCDGRIEVSGTSEFLAADPKARELYLGDKFTLT